MINNTNSLRYILFIFLVFTACEYSNDPIFEENITPPTKEVELDIELSHVLPNNMIYIYQYTELTYSIDTKGKDILDFKISIDADAEIRENKIRLYPLADNSVRKLTFDIQLKTHTGSIADILGYEKYIGKYEYDVKFVKLEENFDLNLKGRRSNEGYLELHWDEPLFDNATLEKYELIFVDDITKETTTHTITNSKQTSFIDKNYTWGHKTYELYAYYKNNDVDHKSIIVDYFTPEYYGFSEPKFNYEYIDNEWMNVTWEYTGYKCKYLIIDADGTKTKCDENQRKIKMQRFRFPSDADRFKLYILPYSLPYEEYLKGHLIEADMVWNDGRYKDTPLPKAWNLLKNEYYYLYRDELEVYSTLSFTKKRDQILREIGYFDRMNMSVSQKTSQIAIYIYKFPTPEQKSDIYIYSDNTFTNPTKLENTNNTGGQLFLTDNYTLLYRKIFRASDADMQAFCVMTNSRTGEIIQLHPLEKEDSKITVSSDGNYMCEYHKGQIWIYKIEGINFTLIYSYTNPKYGYDVCQFSNTNPSELILSGSNETQIFDIETLDVKFQTKGLFITQDPVTGNFACLDEHFSTNSILNIYSNDLSKVLTRIPFKHYTGAYLLLNNRLMHSEWAGGVGFYLDISDYIK